MPEKHLGTEELWRTSEAMLGEALERNGLAVRDQSGRGRVLRAEDRNLRARRAQAAMAARDHPARLQHARALRPDFHHQRRRRGAPGDDPSRDPRFARALHRRPARAYRRRAAVLARARAGAGAFAQRKGRGLRGGDRGDAQARGISRAAADLRNEKLGFKVREAELAKMPYMIVVGEREAAARSVSLRLLRGRQERSHGA